MPRQTGHAERRRHQRVPAPIPFHLLADGKDEPFDLLDLSESGVRITAARALAPMTRIEVRMILPAQRVAAKHDVALELAGVVVWSHKEPKLPTYDIGVFFAELDDRQRNLLRAFVGSHA